MSKLSTVAHEVLSFLINSVDITDRETNIEHIIPVNQKTHSRWLYRLKLTNIDLSSFIWLHMYSSEEIRVDLGSMKKDSFKDFGDFKIKTWLIISFNWSWPKKSSLTKRLYLLTPSPPPPQVDYISGSNIGKIFKFNDKPI